MCVCVENVCVCVCVSLRPTSLMAIARSHQWKEQEQVERGSCEESVCMHASLCVCVCVCLHVCV